ncbi:hypothetical protein [uncultured Deefgea sp.]|uniref:hypothetical protein n=1 Tax=uncultured Deefgea sp. TaxID=1304914 RepID=UPI002592C21A|nr:hypothetical protein [uncultured Deefgea sp.]
MASRPYFRFDIEQLNDLVSKSRDDLKNLTLIQDELKHRNRPKARELKKEVDTLIGALSAESTKPTDNTINQYTPLQVTPDRMVIECTQCKTANFVSPLESVVQHLSCSNCKVAYEAVYKHGILRTQFQALPQINQSNSAAKWITIAVIALIALILILK